MLFEYEWCIIMLSSNLIKALQRQEVAMAIWVTCDRQAVTAFGGRCRNQAGPNGKCVSVASHKDGTAPRADSPDVVLVKPKLHGSTLKAAMAFFPTVLRNEEMFSEANELKATMAGRAFHIRPGAGDSGTAIFGKNIGLKECSASGLPTEIKKAGFTLDNVHCWEQMREGVPTGAGFLVLGHRKGGKEVTLDEDQQAFIRRSFDLNWGTVHVWDNIPEFVGVMGKHTFKFLILKEEDERLLIIATRPKMDEPWWVERAEFTSFRREILHTVNLMERANRSMVLRYNDGLWGADEVSQKDQEAEFLDRLDRGKPLPERWGAK